MSDTTPPDPTTTEEQPVIAPEPKPGTSHTRTILEVIGGVVAAGLIVIAGGVGFLVGHATASDDGEHFGMMRGFIGRGDGMPMDPRGLDPRGDDGGERGEPFGR